MKRSTLHATVDFLSRSVAFFYRPDESLDL